MTSSASWPVPSLIKVPVTVTLSLSSANKAQDIRPRPTATPIDASVVAELDSGVAAAEEELEMLTGAGAEFDSSGSST